MKVPYSFTVLVAKDTIKKKKVVGTVSTFFFTEIHTKSQY